MPISRTIHIYPSFTRRVQEQITKTNYVQKQQQQKHALHENIAESDQQTEQAYF